MYERTCTPCTIYIYVPGTKSLRRSDVLSLSLFFFYLLSSPLACPALLFLSVDMSWWQCLVVLCSLVSWGHCQAPGDGDSICLSGDLARLHPVYPNTFKPLMDSRDYRNLLEESDAVWQQVDVDGPGVGTLVTSVSYYLQPDIVFNLFTVADNFVRSAVSCR